MTHDFFSTQPFKRPQHPLKPACNVKKYTTVASKANLVIFSFFAASASIHAQSISNNSNAANTIPPLLNLLLFDSDNEQVTPPQIKYQLPDSGLLVGGNYPAGINLNCSGIVITQQGCSSGLDATNNDNSDGKAGFSYTKLDVNGQDLPASASTWTCVRDNITSFIWEKKTNDNGVRDKDNTYFWGGVSAEGRGQANAHGEYYDDWNPLVVAANNESLCGFNDWRVPHIKELATLVDRGVTTGPTIDLTYFPNTPEYRFWTSTPGHPDSGDDIGTARRIGFDSGVDRAWFRSGNFSHYHVRLVRTNEYQAVE